MFVNVAILPFRYWRVCPAALYFGSLPTKQGPRMQLTSVSEFMSVGNEQMLSMQSFPGLSTFVTATLMINCLHFTA